MSAQKDLAELIIEAADSIDFGTVSFTVKRSGGLSKAVDITKLTQRRVTGSAQALTLIGSMLKLLGQNGETGNLTFTIALKKGEATDLMTHDFQRDILDLSTGKYS